MAPPDPGPDAGASGGPGSSARGSGTADNGAGAATNGSNGAGNGNGGGSVRTVVPTRAELLLVAAERQLAKEAAARGGMVRLRPAPARSEWVDDGDDVEVVPPRRRVVTVVDPDLLDGTDRRSLGRLRARKVRRIVRHVSPWSVFKVSILFYLCVWLILMVSGVILWRGAQQAGVIENIGKFWAKATGEKYVEIDGRTVFRAAAVGGSLLVFATTGFTVLMTVLFNLITDLVGGVRLTVIELERTKREVRRRARSLDEARLKAADGTDVVIEDDEPAATAVPDPAPSGSAPAVTPVPRPPKVPAAASATSEAAG